MRPPIISPRQIGKFVVFSVIALVIIYVIIMFFVGRPNGPSKAQVPANEFEKSIIDLAKDVYNEAIQAGVDMTVGPCLSESLEIDWVLDVAHLPREPIDDLPENQCAAYRTGQANHFVELDPYGNVIRLK